MKGASGCMLSLLPPEFAHAERVAAPLAVHDDVDHLRQQRLEIGVSESRTSRMLSHHQPECVECASGTLRVQGRNTTRMTGHDSTEVGESSAIAQLLHE